MPMSCLAQAGRLRLYRCLATKAWSRRINIVVQQNCGTRRGSTAKLLLGTAGRRRSACSATASSRADSAEATPVEGPASRLPHIIQTDGVPIHLYVEPEDVETEALQQLRRVAESAMPVGYISAMPDVHLGKGVTIGTVFASEEYVCPNAVGVDIGCGMCAVPVDGLHKDDVSLKQKLLIQSLVKTRVPTGFNMHKGRRPAVRVVLDEISHGTAPTTYLQQLAAGDRAEQQLGTLGSGNHFLEVLHDEGGRVWIMVHSGSRNIGNKTAQYYDGKAKEFLARLSPGGPETHGLDYLRIDSQEGQDYLDDMTWCQAYAFENRAAMLQDMVECVEEATGHTPDLEKAVNIHHNFCSCESCTYADPATREAVTKDLWVTRKGATSAKAGEMGIIPGSMGVGSFITMGRGNPGSWSSCSHGAGRAMSRTKAKADITQEDFVASMTGIVCDTAEAVRDEAPQAYKDLTKVMANQTDLTDIVHRLQPLINVKGFGKNKTKPRGGKPGGKKRAAAAARGPRGAA